MKKIIFKLLVLFSIIINLSRANFSDCGGNKKFEIDTVSVIPIENNENNIISFTIKGFLKENIYEGNIFTIINSGAITFVKEKKPICSSDQSIYCPIESGEIQYNFNISMSKKTPKGQTLYSTVWFTDQNPDQIGCFNINFTL
ncbi:hypothetical protein RB653_006050 [Dictyostelium firmibasis]|uniref:MD-2-related lipid-recognition domain-containing protein n=1 Tax=Dictyostelium firmibasis TaxID=79012 RepID=A0AAN7U2C5_9MYCE